MRSCSQLMSPGDSCFMSGIGFCTDSTHTVSANSTLAAMEKRSFRVFLHPAIVVQVRDVDRYVFDHHFGEHWSRFLHSLLRLPGRAFGFAYRLAKRCFT